MIQLLRRINPRTKDQAAKIQISPSLQTTTSEHSKRENQSTVPRARPERATLILGWSFSSQTLPYWPQRDLATQGVRNVQARKEGYCSLEGKNESEKQSVLWKAGCCCPGHISAHSAWLGAREPSGSWNLLLPLSIQNLHVDSLVNGKRLENFLSSSLIREEFGNILLSTGKKQKYQILRRGGE